MFTGIVAATARIEALRSLGDGVVFECELGPLAADAALGDSIAVDGCCLTIETLEGTRARFHAGRETLGLTTLGALRDGDRVNLEPALALGERLGGHLVSGHVDGVAEVTAVEPEATQTVMRFRLPPALASQVHLKGSICLSGVSLTLIAVEGPEVAVALIPHTLGATTLGERRAGDRINVETDLMGKWLHAMLRPVVEAALDERLGPKTRKEDRP
ncbi:MAG: riboflavin synthase [Planctomycetota bacterium]